MDSSGEKGDRDSLVPKPLLSCSIESRARNVNGWDTDEESLCQTRSAMAVFASEFGD